MNKPQISIILPTFNRAELLPRAIESVLSQSFYDWELIIWDDGSTDNTKSVVESYEDSRISYYYAKNQGVAYARNRAIEQAHGTYLAFLDSDDAWHPEKLLKQIACFKSHPEIDILFTDFLNFNLSNNIHENNFQSHQHVMKSLVSLRMDEHLFIIHSGFLKSLASGNYIATDTVMLQRSSLTTSEPFNENLRNSEDFELWWRLGLAGLKFAYLDQVLMTRYKPVNSLSSASVINIQNQINALDLCAIASVKAHRSDSVPYLHSPYRNAWQNMIIACAQAGDRSGMFNAFQRSLSYGFQLGTLRLLLHGLWATSIAKPKRNKGQI